MGYIYAMRTKNFTKIGFSENPISRLKQLQTGNGETIILDCAAEGTINNEKMLHTYLAKNKRIGEGEWYLTDYVKGVVDKLKRFGITAALKEADFLHSQSLCSENDPQELARSFVYHNCCLKAFLGTGLLRDFEKHLRKEHNVSRKAAVTIAAMHKHNLVVKGLRHGYRA